MTSSVMFWLRRRHRLRVWRPVAWFTGGVFAAEALTARTPETAPARWLGCVALVLLIAGMRWLLRPRLEAVARELDEHHQLANRLEALVSAEAEHSALEQALEAETRAYFAERPVRRPWSDVAALAIAVLAVFWAARTDWRLLTPVKPPPPVAALVPNLKPPAPEPVTVAISPPALPKDAFAILRWPARPNPAQAAPGQTVPITVEARATHGLQNGHLRMTINGRGRIETTVSLAAGKELRPVTVTLDLGSLGARVGDRVTYQVTADAGATPLQTGLQELTVRPWDEAATGAPPPISLPIFTPRAQTPAGRLESLSARQHALVQALGRHDRDEALMSRENAIAKETNNLAVDQAWTASQSASLRAAAADAMAAAAALNEEDAIQASEPAARADLELEKAVRAIDTQGEAAAQQGLLAAQRALLRSADDMQMAQAEDVAAQAQIAAARVQRAEAQLLADAAQQQKAGSADAAQALKEMSQKIQDSKIRPDLQKLSDSQSNAKESNDEGGNKGEAGMEPSKNGAEVKGGGSRGQGSPQQELARRMVALAQRAADAAQGRRARSIAAGTPGGTVRGGVPPGDVINALAAARSDAARLPTYGGAAAKEIYERVQAQEQLVHAWTGQHLPPTPGPGVANLHDYAARLSEQIGKLTTVAQQQLQTEARGYRVSVGDPGEAPQAYRASVADYFEAVARAGSEEDTK